MLIPSGYAQANFIYTGSAVPLGAQWTLGLEITDPPAPSAVAAILEDVYDTADWESVIGTGANLTSILVKYGPNATGPSFELSVNIPSDGGNPSDSPGTSLLVHKVTAFGGRAGRGRMYLPAVPDAGVDLGGVLTSTFLGQVQTRCNDFMGGLDTANFVPVVLHGAGSPLSTPSTITAMVADGQVATQRRRNRR